MENMLLKIQFKNRLCRTLIRINWLLAIATILPIFLKVFIGVTFFVSAFYFLMLIVITIFSLGLLLLNDSFRSLYNINLESLEEFSNQIINIYQIVMPILISLFSIISLLVFLIVIFNQDEMHKKRKIISLLLSSIIVITAVCAYYMKLL